jgi:prepilin-type N-terminal cleavage/methylation domain-containing protein
MLKREAGFTLIEIIVSLVLVGILSVFVGLFMNSFLSGYFMVKNYSETAMKAQMAIDRISMELRDVSDVSVLTDNSLITYTNPLGTGRTIKFVGTNIYLSTPSDNMLIDHIHAFQLSATYRNVYNIVANDIAYIDIGFTVPIDGLPVDKYPKFVTRIFPRIRIDHQ